MRNHCVFSIFLLTSSLACGQSTGDERQRESYWRTVCSAGPTAATRSQGGTRQGDARLIAALPEADYGNWRVKLTDGSVIPLRSSPCGAPTVAEIRAIADKITYGSAGHDSNQQRTVIQEVSSRKSASLLRGLGYLVYDGDSTGYGYTDVSDVREVIAEQYITGKRGAIRTKKVKFNHDFIDTFVTKLCTPEEMEAMLAILNGYQQELASMSGVGQQSNPVAAQGSSSTGSSGLVGVWSNETATAVNYVKTRLVLRPDGTYTKTFGARPPTMGGGVVGAPTWGDTHSGTWTQTGPMRVTLSGDDRHSAYEQDLTRLQRVE